MRNFLEKRLPERRPSAAEESIAGREGLGSDCTGGNSAREVLVEVIPVLDFDRTALQVPVYRPPLGSFWRHLRPVLRSPRIMLPTVTGRVRT